MRDSLGLWIPPNYYLSMATVISSAWTTEGFVIGSDGRKTGYVYPDILSDDAQKIHPIERRGMRMAYGLSGTISIGESVGAVSFDFESELKRAIGGVGRRTVWGNYLSALMKTLQQSVNAMRATAGKPFEKEDATTIYLGGYHEGALSLGDIRFDHGIETTTSVFHSYPEGFSFPWGSREVFNLLNSRDPRFANFIDPVRSESMTLAEGIERVRKDILAHYDPEAEKLDGMIPWRIGGRVQIATITRSDGFQWVRGFEPASVDRSMIS